MSCLTYGWTPWDNGRWVRFGVGILVLEFLVIHSGAFIGSVTSTDHSLAKNITLIVGLLTFYLLMAVGVALSTASLHLVGLLAAIMVGRFVNALNARPAAKTIAQHRSAYGVVLYLTVAAGTVFIDVPQWGITYDVLNTVYPTRGSGVWEQHPERAIVGGAIYFALMGIGELTFLRLKNPQTRTVDL